MLKTLSIFLNSRAANSNGNMTDPILLWDSTFPSVSIIATAPRAGTAQQTAALSQIVNSEAI
jgi:hypothetical protein